MSLLAFLLRASRGTAILSVFTGVLSGLSGVALIAFIHAELARTGPPSPLLAWAFAGLCLVSAASRVAAQYAMVRLGQGTVARLCLHLCRKILAMPLVEFERSDPGGLLAVLTQDIGVVTNALVGIPQLCINVPLVIACFLYVGWLSPAVFACGVVFAAVAIAAYLAIGGIAQAEFGAARNVQDRLVGHFRAISEGFRELKQHRGRREAFLNEGLAPAIGDARDRTVKGLAYFAAAEGWSQLAFFGFIGLILFALPAFGTYRRADLAGVVLVVLYLMTPLDTILNWLPAVGRARASMRKINALVPSLEARVSEEDLAGTVSAPLFRDSIRLEDISYTYPAEADGDGFALGPVDLTIHAGETVFLAGGNGSGKTTLVKLLAGLYAPETGSVTLDGRAVGEDDREAYRQLFSVVFADGHLFPDLLGIDRPGLGDEARDGLERLGLSGRVRFEGRSFSTTDLSQGQRRRLALLSALLERRPVCVFDEWAANQDPHFKKFFYLELLPELKARGKTLLVISHDEDYYEAADRVVRLRDGLVTETTRATAGVGAESLP